MKSVKTWTTDGFYRKTKEMVMYRKEEGCKVVEMECSALTASASGCNIRVNIVCRRYTGKSVKHDDRS